MDQADLDQLVKQVGTLLAPIKDRLLKLEATHSAKAPLTEPSTSSEKAESAAAVAQHGMCEDQACDACMGASQDIADAALAQGRLAALEDLDQWLIMAGGEELRQKIIEMAARGQQLYEHAQQGVTIVDGR